MPCPFHKSGCEGFNSEKEFPWLCAKCVKILQQSNVDVVARILRINKKRELEGMK